MNKWKVRNLHASLGFFYVGLIISFALSGLLMNHREYWHPEKYQVQTRKVILESLPEKENLNQETVEQLVETLGVEDEVRRYIQKKGTLRIMCRVHEVEIDLKTGEGEVTQFEKTPFISQIMGLHKSSSHWWVYYSDIFALSLITIAVTGLMLMPPKGRSRRKAMVLALSGILFPIFFAWLLLV